MILGKLPEGMSLREAAEMLCGNAKTQGLCGSQHSKHHLLPALYHQALLRARGEELGKHRFPFQEHRFGPHIDYSTDAIIYVTVVVVFYAAIIILLVTTNFRRKRHNRTRSSNAAEVTNEDGMTNESTVANVKPPAQRKHWLFFNPISGEAQQATKEESQHFIHCQDAETV